MTINRYIQSFLFGFKVIFRPIKRFYTMKREKKGTLAVGLTIVGLLILTNILQLQLTRFIFLSPMYDPAKLNIINVAISILVPFFLWCVSNWCLTSLMDGEGSFKDIVMATGYALLPMVIIQLPLIALSWFFTLEEQGFYTMLSTFGTIFSLLLIFISNMVIHQYSLRKALGAIILTIGGMGLIAFIALLFSTLIQQMYVFGYSIYKELIFRI